MYQKVGYHSQINMMYIIFIMQTNIVYINLINVWFRLKELNRFMITLVLLKIRLDFIYKNLIY